MGNERWTRRQFVGRAGKTAGGVVFGLGPADVLAAWGTSSPGTAGTGKLEIFSWWTGPGEKDGLAEMFKIYKNKYPNVTITNSAVAGGAGSTAKAVLATRMQGGRPPDSFQVHAGQELIASWVKANKMESITSIWNAEGWDSKIPKDLKDIVSSNGEVWSVPVNVHRGNALWDNKKLLDSKGVSPPETPEQLTSALSALKAKGVANPLALASQGGNWQVQMLLENNVLAAGGAQSRQGRRLAESLWFSRGSGRLQSEEGLDPRQDRRVPQWLRCHRPGVHRRVQDGHARTQLGARLGDAPELRQRGQR